MTFDFHSAVFDDRPSSRETGRSALGCGELILCDRCKLRLYVYPMGKHQINNFSQGPCRFIRSSLDCSLFDVISSCTKRVFAGKFEKKNILTDIFFFFRTADYAVKVWRSQRVRAFR